LLLSDGKGRVDCCISRSWSVAMIHDIANARWGVLIFIFKVVLVFSWLFVESNTLASRVPLSFSPSFNAHDG
jgi:hypothetical protein